MPRGVVSLRGATRPAFNTKAWPRICPESEAGNWLVIFLRIYLLTRRMPYLPHSSLKNNLLPEHPSFARPLPLHGIEICFPDTRASSTPEERAWTTAPCCVFGADGCVFHWCQCVSDSRSCVGRSKYEPRRACHDGVYCPVLLILEHARCQATDTTRTAGHSTGAAGVDDLVRRLICNQTLLLPPRRCTSSSSSCGSFRSAGG
jgi:hypothetical protein